MSDEIEYIEPTQEHVGQMVEVRDSGDSNWVEAKLTGILQDEFSFAVKRKWDGFSFAWRFARIARPLTYADRQARCGLKVGDRVRIASLPATEQDGWGDSVSHSMHRIVGSVHYIRANNGPYGFNVGGWNWPYFVLEKVEARVATHLDIGSKVYVTGSPEDEFELTHVYRDVGELNINDTFAVVRSGDKRFVYELSNLRVKE